MGWESKRETRVRDRISELPNAVLCHILGFLPAKYAFRTSILSTRWKNIWASVPNLDFEYKANSILWSKEFKLEYDRFLSFVDRAISLREDSVDIERFRLRCVSCAEDLPRIDGWIRTAINHNVVDLDLHVEALSAEEDGVRPLELPQCVFLCKTLVALKVMSDCIIYVPPISRCFPSLKLLHVVVEYPDNNSVEKIFSCCPVLESLTIHALVGLDDVLNFNIFLPKLKTLSLELVHSSWVDDHDHAYNIFINCPKLENLDIKQDNLSNYSFLNVNSLVKANVNLCYHFADHQHDFYTRATALLAGLSKVKCLSLSAHFAEGSCLPTFDNLSELKLVLHDCYQWDLLTELLRKSPCLELLVVQHKEDIQCVEDYEDHDRYLKHVLFSEDRWSKPEFVPACLISNLKTVAIEGFKGYPHEKKVAKYLLENGKVLSKLTIYNDLSTEFA